MKFRIKHMCYTARPKWTFDVVRFRTSF